MKTRPGLRLLFCLLMIGLILLPGCRPAAPATVAAPIETGAPTAVKAAAATAAAPITPTAPPTTAAAAAANPLETFLGALDALNASPAFSYNLQYTTLQKQKVAFPGQPANEGSSLVSTSESGARLLAGGQPNISVKRTLRFMGQSNADDMQSEFRLVDGQLFLKAAFLSPAANQPVNGAAPLPEGWVPVYGASTPAGWLALDDASFRALPAEVGGDAWSLLTGATAQRYRQALTDSLDSISQAPGQLADGSPAQVITVKFKPGALPLLLRWVDFDNPVNMKVFAAVQGAPLTLRLSLNSAGRPSALESSFILDAASLDIGGLAGTPAGTTFTLHAELSTKVQISLGGSFSPVTVPDAGQMARFPAYTGAQAKFPFKTLGEFDQAINQAASGGQMEAFWQQLAGVSMPLIFEDRVAFLYRGPADIVSWQGDWNDRSGSVGQRLGSSDTWFTLVHLPQNAHLEYQIQLDDQPPVIDPLNPNQETGGLGTKSALFMPEYKLPGYIQPRASGPKGQLSENITLQSHSLGYPVNYRVYTPAGYAKLNRLPVLYVTDGQDFLQFGHLDVALDNLIADGKIRPVMAVFIDPRDTKTGENLRNDQFFDNLKYAEFVAKELVPAVDTAYRTDANADARAILGASNGGYFAAYLGLQQAGTFHLIGMHSPSIWHNPAIIDTYRQMARLPLKFFISTGTWSDTNYHANLLKKALEETGYPVFYIESNEGHSYANWRGKFEQLLAYFFPPQ